MYAARLEEKLESSYNLDAIVGIGNVADSLGLISVSYAQSSEVIKYKFLIPDSNLYFYELIPDGDEYFYSLESETALFKSVRESDYESAKKVLQEIYEENFLNHSLGVDAIKIIGEF